MPNKRERLRYVGQFVDDLAEAPEAMVYIIYYSGTNDIAATATVKRYLGNDTPLSEIPHPWHRVGPVPPNTEAWELKTMAVDPALQGQGLAGYLMRLVESAVIRRFKDSRQRSKTARSDRLVMMLTATKEKYGAFYEKRGFVEDYAVQYEKGHAGQ